MGSFLFLLLMPEPFARTSPSCPVLWEPPPPLLLKTWPSQYFHPLLCGDEKRMCESALLMVHLSLLLLVQMLCSYLLSAQGPKPVSSPFFLHPDSHAFSPPPFSLLAPTFPGPTYLTEQLFSHSAKFLSSPHSNSPFPLILRAWPLLQNFKTPSGLHFSASKIYQSFYKMPHI